MKVRNKMTHAMKFINNSRKTRHMDIIANNKAKQSVYISPLMSNPHRHTYADWLQLFPSYKYSFFVPQNTGYYDTD